MLLPCKVAIALLFSDLDRFIVLEALNHLCRPGVGEKGEGLIPPSDSLQSSPSPCARLLPKVHDSHCSHRDISPSLLGEYVELLRRCRRRLQRLDQKTCSTLVVSQAVAGNVI